MEFIDYKCLESLIIEGEGMIATEGIKDAFNSIMTSIKGIFKKHPKGSRQDSNKDGNAVFTTLVGYVSDYWDNIMKIDDVINKFSRKQISYDECIKQTDAIIDELVDIQQSMSKLMEPVDASYVMNTSRDNINKCGSMSAQYYNTALAFENELLDAIEDMDKAAEKMKKKTDEYTHMKTVIHFKTRLSDLVINYLKFCQNILDFFKALILKL